MDASWTSARRLSELHINKLMAERVGFEFTRKRSFNDIERTAGTVKQWKAMVSSVNGSQTDHRTFSSNRCKA
jgi:hypothetical protein